MAGAAEQRRELFARHVMLSRTSQTFDPLQTAILGKGQFTPTRKYCLNNITVKHEIYKQDKSTLYVCEIDGKEFLLKVYSSSEGPSVPWKELELLRKLEHPGIIQLHGAFRDKRTCLVLDMCFGKNESSCLNECLFVNRFLNVYSFL